MGVGNGNEPVEIEEKEYLRDDWTSEQEDMLRDLVKQGRKVSYVDIAIRLGKKFGKLFTRNECIRKARQIGIIKQRAKVLREPVVKKEVTVGLRTKFNPHPKIHKQEPHILPKTKVPEGALFLKFSQLREFHCKFELSDIETMPSNFRFCGLSRIEGSQYCEYHHKICLSNQRVLTPKKIPIPMRIR